MTTFRTIASTETDPEAPVTSTLMKALQQNLLAVAEKDASVPLTWQIGTVLLGTLTTTSGTTQTLSSLTLTSFTHLRLFFRGVGVNATGAAITVGGANVIASSTASGNRYRGICEIDLSGGDGWSCLADVNAAAPSATAATVFNQRTSLTTASTSVSVATTAIAFNAGSVLIFGVK